MSYWTHVAAVARVDAIRIPELRKNIPGLNVEINFESIFGKECHADSPREVWDDLYSNPEDYLPGGSEGTLYMEVWTNPNINDCAAYTVAIFGDLRDFDSANDIINWFKAKCERKSFYYDVTTACIVASSDCDDNVQSWSYG